MSDKFRTHGLRPWQSLAGMTREEAIKAHRVGLEYIMDKTGKKVGTLVKSYHVTDEIDDLEYQVANLNPYKKRVDDLVISHDSLREEFADIRERMLKPVSLREYIKAWIRHWLDIENIGT